ncbi:lactate permease [Salibacterium salarium]|uniref:L-lactate permease n=1 Tax=Salibacterium salarium TaxID=284579 RepID=UPI0027874A56|nr:L-lactate permease [Salibacterium salarium]MDQ0298457.1 lactate permease [Salibacterium salarium]
MNFVAALLPIIGIFFLLFVWKQSSLKAGLAAYAVTVVITLSHSSFALEIQEIVNASIKGLLTSFIVAYVLLFGIFLFHLMNKAGAIDDIAAFISQSTDDQITQTIILVTGFSPLIESTSGFGTAFFIVTPIFIALGFHRFKAVLLGLISLLAVPWGALATGTMIGSDLGNIPISNLGIGSAIISIPIFVYFVTIVVYVAGGWRALREKRRAILLYSLTFGISLLFFNTYISVELSGVLASFVTVGIGLTVIKKQRKRRNTTTKETIPKRLSIIKLASPYLLLTICIFISRLVPPIKHFFHSHIVIDLPAYSFSLALLYSPGFWLCVTCLFTIIIFQIQRDVIWNAWKASLKQWIPFVIATTGFVSMSEVMADAGMIAQIATTTTTVFGSSFIFLSPFIGGLGGFLTGSNTGANAMFMKLQVQTAHQLDIPPDILAFSQNTSASHVTMASPSRVMVGAALCDMKSQENRLLKSISLIAGGALLLIVSITFGWIWFVS